MIATVLLRKRPPPASAPPVIEILARALILLVVMAAIIIDVQLIVPAAPAIGRPALYLIGAVFIEVTQRLLAALPNAPRWLPRALRVFELVLIATAVVGIVLMVVVRRV